MSGVATMMAAALAAVLAVAAAGKISSPQATVTEFTQLRIPAPKMLTLVVPVIELLVATGLLVRPSYGGPAAALLLAAFTGVLIATVRSGRVVSCGCLGAISRQPVTVATVARNVVLLAMAGAASTASQPVLPDLASVMVSATVLLLALVLVQMLALHQTLGRFWSVELAGESPAKRKEELS